MLPVFIYGGLLHFGNPSGRSFSLRRGGNGKSMRRDIGVFLFALGLAFFSWPLMGIFKDSLILYLSTVWFVFIALLVIATIISEKEEDGR